MDFFKMDFVTDYGYCDIKKIYCHESVVLERVNKFVNYLRSLEPLIILPSIIVCNKTNVLIDGHHRCQALLQLGFMRCPVTYIDYSHKSILPHLDDSISKEDIIYAGLTGSLLPPKSSFHHLLDKNGRLRPIVLLSHLVDMREEVAV